MAQLPVEIKKGIYWVGAVDWNVRTFHGHTYTTKRGTTYNAYLIVDEKVCLVDTVMAPFAGELLQRIKEILPPERIDYVVANHVETDHSGALPVLMQACPRAQLLGTAKCREGLEKSYHRQWPFQVVKSGERLALGRRSLQFIEAPMIHWPDSMFSYCPEEKLLMPNDAFGQHYASAERFDDETDQCALMEEAQRYYANILLPLSGVILRKLQELQQAKLPIDMIAPSHGIIWRKDPGKIVNAYLRWAQNTTAPKVVVAYESMWGTTAEMARRIAAGMTEAGVEVKLYDVAVSDTTDMIAQFLDAKGIVLGSSTHDNDMLPFMAAFASFFKGLKPKNRLGAAFGSYGWAGGALKSLEGIIKDAGVEMALPSLGVQFVPDEAGYRACYEWGKEFARRVV